MTLTEQWKKGELPSGFYYVKNEFNNIFPSDYSESYDCINDTVIKDFFTEVSEIKEVLKPVPSYEEWVMTKNLSERAHIEMYKARGEKVKLENENAKLKKLLKECIEYVKKDYDDYLTYTQSAIYQEISELLGDNNAG